MMTFTRCLIVVLLLCLPVLVQAVPLDLADATVSASTLDGLRLRAAPSEEAAILEVLPAAAPLMLVGRDESGAWLQAYAPDGRVGWVAAAYVDVVLDVNLLPTLISGSALYPRLRLGEWVAENVRSLYQAGQTLGNHGDRVAKVGDSITVSANFLYPIADGFYEVSEYPYLQTVIDRFAAIPASSFSRTSLAAGVGWNSTTVLNPAYADPTPCLVGEVPLLCEYRLLKPAFAIIMFGTNDVGLIPLESYRRHMDDIIRFTLGQGIIPLVSTIPDRRDHTEEIALFNRALIGLAHAYAIPLIDYAAPMQTLPEGGLTLDGVHPSSPARGYKGSADFRAGNLDAGYVVRNLTALLMLDAVLDALGKE